MMDSEVDNDGVEDLLAEVDVTEPVHSLAPSKEFSPWHHPRKQFVRIRQWCAEIQKLVPQLGLGAGDPFRYLTLPGNEMLDVRALHGVAERLGFKLRYLGFNNVSPNTPAQAELALSQSEVRSLSSIDEFSIVIEDKLEAVANDRSTASVQTRKAGPFHAINLDLCDAIAFREIGHAKGSMLEATGKLLQLQLQSTTPWLLFVTTKAEPELLGEFAKTGFGKVIAANTSASDDFRTKLASLIEGDISQLDADLAKAWNSQDPSFLRLFCTGLGKWLLSILSNAAPPRELTLLSSCYYQSGPNGPDMLSLAFRCGPAVQQVKDHSEILPQQQISAEASEIESAIRLADSIGDMFDLDAHLANDKALQDKLITQAGKLMASARYAETDFETWARAKFA